MRRFSNVLTITRDRRCLRAFLFQVEHLVDDVEETRLLWIVVIDKIHQVIVVHDVSNDSLRRRSVLVQLAPLFRPQLERLVLQRFTNNIHVHRLFPRRNTITLHQQFVPNIGMVGKGVNRRIMLSWSTPNID